MLKREKHAQRHRRLEPYEEASLLKHGGAHLQRLIIAARETGCRRGELLSLQWREINLERREITIRSEHSKTGMSRIIPISAKLKAVLAMVTTDPDGKEFGPDAYVLGDPIGDQVKDVKRAWETCVLSFHDLRHEAGSRLLEAGWPLHNVSHMLGHANISQTSTYLNATRIGLQDSMRKLDEARGCKPVASSTETDRPLFATNLRARRKR